MGNELQTDPARACDEAVKATIREQASNGIKGVDLALEVATRHPSAVDSILGIVAAMVTDGDLTEVEYVTPDNDRDGAALVKSFYLPAGTRVRLPEGNAA